MVLRFLRTSIFFMLSSPARMLNTSLVIMVWIYDCMGRSVLLLEMSRQSILSA